MGQWFLKNINCRMNRFNRHYTQSHHHNHYVLQEKQRHPFFQYQKVWSGEGVLLYVYEEFTWPHMVFLKTPTKSMSQIVRKGQKEKCPESHNHGKSADINVKRHLRDYHFLISCTRCWHLKVFLQDLHSPDLQAGKNSLFISLLNWSPSPQALHVTSTLL